VEYLKITPASKNTLITGKEKIRANNPIWEMVPAGLVTADDE
jgi:hypothetical protein